MNVIGPNTVGDDTDLFLFPTSVMDREFVLVELGTAGSAGAYGVLAKKVGKGNLGVAISHQPSIFTSAVYAPGVSLVDSWTRGNTDNVNPAFLLPVPERPIDVVFAMPQGKNRLAIGLNFASYKSYLDNGAGPKNIVKSDADQLGFKLGYQLMSEVPIEVSLGFSVIAKTRRVTETAAGKAENSYDEGGGKHISLAVRNLVQKKYYALARIEPRNPKLTANTPAVKKDAQISELAGSVAGGVILSPVDGTLIIAGGEFMSIKSKGPVTAGAGATAVPSFATNDNRVDLKADILAANAGIETKVSESFGALAGMRYNVWGNVVRNDKIATTAPKTETSINDTSDAVLCSLGLFYTAGLLRVDASFDDTFLFAGPYLVSGNARGGASPLFTQLSVSYSM
jgi:hypothetical protein